MLTPDYLKNVADDAVNVYAKLENSIIKDIVRRLQDTDFQMTESARFQIQIAQESGMLYDDIIKKVARQGFKIDASFYIPIMDFMCKIFGKFSIKNVSTVDTIKNTNMPIMLIHGTNDNFVPCEMSKTAFKSANENSKLVLVDGADHGISFLVDTKRVVEELKEFLNKNLC